LLNGHVSQTILQHMGKIAAPFSELPAESLDEDGKETEVFEP